MKISDLEDILKNIKDVHGDKHIWSMDIEELPCPDKVSLELVGTLERTEYGYTGGKVGDNVEVECVIEYDEDDEGLQTVEILETFY